jgi:hypothetical protein
LGSRDLFFASLAVICSAAQNAGKPSIRKEGFIEFESIATWYSLVLWSFGRSESGLYSKNRRYYGTLIKNDQRKKNNASEHLKLHAIQTLTAKHTHILSTLSPIFGANSQVLRCTTYIVMTPTRSGRDDDISGTKRPDEKAKSTFPYPE